MTLNSVPPKGARLGLLEQVNTYLATLIELDASHIEQHLARLDHLLGLESLANHHAANNGCNPLDTTTRTNNHSITAEVEAAGISLDYELKTLVMESDPKVIRDAIGVVQENRKRGVVYSPSGLFRRAVENHWKPSHKRESNVKA